MNEGTTKKPWVWLGLVAVCFTCFSLLGLQPPIFTSLVHPQPLHADEAVQWSLAKDLSEGVLYSSHDDRFHGPTLASSLLICSKATGTAFADMSESYLRNVTGFYLVLLSLAALALPSASSASPRSLPTPAAKLAKP